MGLMMQGCSSKYPSMKTGAIYGTLGGMVMAVTIGTKDTNSDYASAIAVAAIILGLAGATVGAGVGYVVDSISQRDEKMKAMIESQHTLEMK